jgi:hypothetical protein
MMCTISVNYNKSLKITSAKLHPLNPYRVQNCQERYAHISNHRFPQRGDTAIARMIFYQTMPCVILPILMAATMLEGLSF